MLPIEGRMSIGEAPRHACAPRSPLAFGAVRLWGARFSLLGRSRGFARRQGDCTARARQAVATAQAHG
jgi:hypothetical protein